MIRGPVMAASVSFLASVAGGHEHAAWADVKSGTPEPQCLQILYKGLWTLPTEDFAVITRYVGPGKKPRVRSICVVPSDLELTTRVVGFSVGAMAQEIQRHATPKERVREIAINHTHGKAAIESACPTFGIDKATCARVLSHPTSVGDVHFAAILKGRSSVLPGEYLKNAFGSDVLIYNTVIDLPGVMWKHRTFKDGERDVMYPEIAEAIKKVPQLATLEEELNKQGARLRVLVEQEDRRIRDKLNAITDELTEHARLSDESVTKLQNLFEQLRITNAVFKDQSQYVVLGEGEKIRWEQYGASDSDPISQDTWRSFLNEPTSAKTKETAIFLPAHDRLKMLVGGIHRAETPDEEMLYVEKLFFSTREEGLALFRHVRELKREIEIIRAAAGQIVSRDGLLNRAIVKWMIQSTHYTIHTVRDMFDQEKGLLGELKFNYALYGLHTEVEMGPDTAPKKK